MANNWSTPHLQQQPGMPQPQPVQGGQNIRDIRRAEAQAKGETAPELGMPGEDMPELVASLLAQKQAGGELTGMDAQLMRAAKLRDKEYNENGEFTTGGIGAAMGGMANYLDRQRGQREYGELSQEMSAAREKIAQGEADTLEHELKRQARGDQTSIDKEQRRIFEDDRDAAALAEYREQTLGLKRAKAAAGGGGKSGTAAKSLTAGSLKSYEDLASVASGAELLANNFRDSVAQIADIPTGPLNEGARLLQRHGLLQYGTKNQDLIDQTAQQERWTADWDRLVNQETRSRLFGAALTVPEQKLFDLANGMKVGGDSELMAERAQHMAMAYKMNAYNRLAVASDKYSSLPHDLKAIHRIAGQAGLEVGEDGQIIPPMSPEQYDKQMAEYYAVNRGRGGSRDRGNLVGPLGDPEPEEANPLAGFSDEELLQMQAQ